LSPPSVARPRAAGPFPRKRERAEAGGGPPSASGPWGFSASFAAPGRRWPRSLPRPCVQRVGTWPRSLPRNRGRPRRGWFAVVRVYERLPETFGCVQPVRKPGKTTRRSRTKKAERFSGPARSRPPKGFLADPDDPRTKTISLFRPVGVQIPRERADGWAVPSARGIGATGYLPRDRQKNAATVR